MQPRRQPRSPGARRRRRPHRARRPPTGGASWMSIRARRVRPAPACRGSRGGRLRRRQRWHTAVILLRRVSWERRKGRASEGSRLAPCCGVATQHCSSLAAPGAEEAHSCCSMQHQLAFALWPAPFFVPGALLSQCYPNALLCRHRWRRRHRRPPATQPCTPTGCGCHRGKQPLPPTWRGQHQRPAQCAQHGPSRHPRQAQQGGTGRQRRRPGPRCRPAAPCTVWQQRCGPRCTPPAGRAAALCGHQYAHRRR